jgi:hypothetical protein
LIWLANSQVGGAVFFPFFHGCFFCCFWSGLISEQARP